MSPIDTNICLWFLPRSGTCRIINMFAPCQRLVLILPTGPVFVPVLSWCKIMKNEQNLLCEGKQTKICATKTSNSIRKYEAFHFKWWSLSHLSALCLKFNFHIYWVHKLSSTVNVEWCLGSFIYLDRIRVGNRYEHVIISTNKNVISLQLINDELENSCFPWIRS